MFCSKRVLTKRFVSEDGNSKEAYLMACKWLAKNVISKKDEIGSYSYEITKDEKAENTTFVLTLYAVLDESEINKKNCEVCREAHELFYVNNECNCNSCREQAYRRRMEEKLNIKAEYLKSVIRRKVKDI